MFTVYQLTPASQMFIYQSPRLTRAIIGARLALRGERWGRFVVVDEGGGVVWDSRGN